MWRIWNCVPRFVRQQCHGPRASAGVCVEEEKGDHEKEKATVLTDSPQDQQGARNWDTAGHGCRWRHHRGHFKHSRFHRLHKQEAQERDGEVGGRQDEGTAAWGQEEGQKAQGQFWSRASGQEGERASHSRHGHWWKQRCRRQSWTSMWSQQQSLDKVTWSAAMVFGLQLSRKPQFWNFLDWWRNDSGGGNRGNQWWSLLLNVAFARPSEGTARSIVGQRGVNPQPLQADATTQPPVNVQKTSPSPSLSPPLSVPETEPSEDHQTLSDVMREFEASCQTYAAVANSVSGVLAAEQGQTTAAMEHLREASRLGHAPAIFNLAVCHDTGLGVEKDQKLAAVYYQRAADLGHAQSLFNLALMTLHGDGGLTKDRTKALELLTRAAKQGLAQAQTYLGVYYTENDDNQQDFEEAASFFKAAASQNDAEAQYFLGVCYENGWGVESSDQEAARLYSSAALLDHDTAMYNLAAFHEYGLGGVERDEEQALALYRQAAQLGNDSAQLRLDEHEARKAVNMWAEQNSSSSETAADLSSSSSSPPSSPGLRHSPKRSSSPVLSDFVRESMAGIWSGELSAWFSAQSLTTTPSTTTSSSSSSPTSALPRLVVSDNSSRHHHHHHHHLHQHHHSGRARFMLGDGDDSPSSSSSSSSSLLSADVDLPLWLGVGQGGCGGLHRTSTMPELRMVSCQ